MSGLRVAVIGLGFGATVHVPAFLSEGWAVPVVWSRRLSRAQEQAAAFSIPEGTDDYAAILARDDIDAVAIATPPPGHYAMASAALAAGKHVLCEKPFTLNAAEARALADQARDAGLVGMVAHEFRYAPQRQHIKQLVDEGYVGTPQVAQWELFLGGRVPPTPPALGASVAEGGGMLGGLGSHYIDAFRHWFGDVESVSGVLRGLRPDRTDANGAIVQADAEDTFQFTLTFKNGAIASMTASTAVGPAQGGRLFISGSGGSLLATQPGPNPEPDGVVLGARMGERPLMELPMPPEYHPFDDDRDNRLMAFRLMIREFERGIRGETSPTPSFEDGWRCRQLLDAVRRASEEQRTVRID
jgi:predicted dehydrogenase